MIVKEFLPELVKMEGLEVLSIMGSPSGFAKAEALSQQYGIPQAVSNLEELCEFWLLQKGTRNGNERHCGEADDG